MSSVTSILPETASAAAHEALLEDWVAFTAKSRSTEASEETVIDDDEFCATMLGGYVQDPISPTYTLRKAGRADYRRWRRAVRASGSKSRDDELLIRSHLCAILGRKLFRTDRGSLGVGPPSLRPGDSWTSQRW